MRHYYHNTITEFIAQPFDAIWAQLTAVGRGDLLHTQKQAWAEKREKLIMDSDRTFSSPSTAADFCLGRSCNGWTIWKDKDDETLDSVYRKQLE